MPWTAKQLKLFRAAAHNPAIAKSSGIKQSDAERMSKEGLKKMSAGGEMKINKQDTRHGKMDMPFKKLNKFAGFKKGGVMKKRRFDEGGDVDYEVDENAEPERKYFASGVSAKDREYTPPKAAAKATPKPAVADYGDEGERLRSRYPAKEDTRGTMARSVKSMGFRRDMPSSEQKERNAPKLAEEAGLAALGGGYGKMLQGAYRAGKAADAARTAATRYAETPAMRAMGKANEAKFAARREAERAAESEARKKVYGSGYKKGGLMRSKGDIGKDQMSMAPYKKGGEMKESKAMMKKEIGFMQKKGAPASMIKHEKAEMKGYARGGGVESRGKTKGTIIKMAAGGSVRAHGEHSIQKKGHTRGKMC
jgi:hypothetical protein